MKVLVTGGAGYIGSHTCVEVLKSGHDVLVVDSLINAEETALSRIAKVAGTAPRFVKCDLRDGPALVQILDAFRPDAVIHFAGLKSVSESVKNPLAYYDVNVGGTLRLLEAMAGANCERIIFSSSATVYGAPQYLPYDEDHPKNPVQPYGKTKWMVEQILADWCASNPKHRAITLRYSNPVGAHPSGLLGENPRGVPQNLMPYIAQVASGQRPHLNIYGNDYDTVDGTGVRDYIHVCDLAEAHLKALMMQDKLDPHESLNIGSGQGISVLEMVHAFEAASSLQIPHQFKPRRDGDLAQYWADAGRAAQRLGFTPSRTVDDMCSDTWRWTQMRG